MFGFFAFQGLGGMINALTRGHAMLFREANGDGFRFVGEPVSRRRPCFVSMARPGPWTGPDLILPPRSRH